MPRVLDLHEYLLEQESRLQATFGPKIQLTFQWLATDAQVLASAEDLDEILNSLIDAAVAARPIGGALAVGTGWLDVIGPDATGGGEPQPYVRVTVAEDHEPHDAGLSLIAGVIPIVRRLRGFVMLDRAPDDRRRVHVCLPIVNVPPGDAA
jgi:hypothetical protein